MPKKKQDDPPATGKFVPPSLAELLALYLVPGIGQAGVRIVLATAEREALSVPGLFGKSIRQLANVFPPSHHRLAQALSESTPAVLSRAETLLARVNDLGALVTVLSDPAYPSALRTALGKTAPMFLFLRGNVALLDMPAAGIVGTRRPSALGLQLAQACARTFSGAKIPVVSGGARGVDTAAHETVVSEGGATIVVLPQGLLTYTIPSSLVSAFKEKRLLLVSECAPDAGWATHAAVTRNATISALSRMVCVIEPHSENGSLLTARHALDQGKRVFYAGLPAMHPLERRPGIAPMLDKKGHFDSNTMIQAFHSTDAAPPDQQWMC
jgi:DNA processing protein